MCKGKDRKKGVRPNILFPKPPKKPCPSGNSFRGNLPQHPTGKIALLSGCCNARDWVFVMSMAPDCATFDTIFGYFWLNLFVYFYFRKSVWLESLVGLFKQKCVHWALELGPF